MSDTETGKAAMVRVPPPNVFVADGTALTRWEPTFEFVYVDPNGDGCCLTLARSGAASRSINLSRDEALALADLIRKAVS